MRRFADRAAAGRQLGAALVARGLQDPLVLALPRGGVVVAAEVAAALRAHLDVLVVRKIGHPAQPELGLGAVAEDGAPVLEDDRLRRVGLGPADLGVVVAQEQAECRRRVAAYRGGRPAPEVARPTVVLVDDGVATGGTARAALRLLRARGAGRLVLAAPVGSPTSVDRLAGLVDETMVLVAPGGFRAVSQFYDRFDQTSDAEVVQLLRSTAQ